MGQWVRKRKGRGSELVYVPDEHELAMGIDAESAQRVAAPFQTALIAGGGDPNSQGGRAMIGSSAMERGSPWLQSYLDAGLVQSGQIHPPRGTPSIIEAMKLPRDRLGREVEKKKADKRQTVTKTDADGNTTVTVTDTEDLDTVKEKESQPSLWEQINRGDTYPTDEIGEEYMFPTSPEVSAPYWAGEQFPESTYLGSERQVDNTAHWQQMLKERQMREAMEGYGPRAPAEPSLWEQINRGDTYAPEELGEVGPAGVEEIFGPRPPAAPAEVSADPRFEMLGQGPDTQMGYPDPSWTAEPPGMSTPPTTLRDDDLPEYGMGGMEEVFAPGPEMMTVLGAGKGPRGMGEQETREVEVIDGEQGTVLQEMFDPEGAGGQGGFLGSGQSAGEWWEDFQEGPEWDKPVTEEDEVIPEIVGPEEITGPGDYPTDMHPLVPTTPEEAEAASGAANTDSNAIRSRAEILGEGAETAGTEQFDPARIYAKFDKDIGGEKERYLAEYNKVMKRAMMLNAIAAMTGGKSYADVYVTAAMAKFDKMKGYDDQARFKKISQGVYWKEDGTFDAPKSKKQAYTRALRFGATAEEAAKIAGWDEAEVAKKQFVNWHNPETGEAAAVRQGSAKGEKLAAAGWLRGADSNDISGTGRERLNASIQTALDMGSPGQALNALLSGWDTTYDPMGDKDLMFQKALQAIGDRMLRQGAFNPAIKTYDSSGDKGPMTGAMEQELMDQGFKFAYNGAKIERLDGIEDTGVEPTDEDGWISRGWDRIKDMFSPEDQPEAKKKYEARQRRGSR